MGRFPAASLSSSASAAAVVVVGGAEEGKSAALMVEVQEWRGELDTRFSRLPSGE